MALRWALPDAGLLALGGIVVGASEWMWLSLAAGRWWCSRVEARLFESARQDFFIDGR
jgi:hypothetical protein